MMREKNGRVYMYSEVACVVYIYIYRSTRYMYIVYTLARYGKRTTLIENTVVGFIVNRRKMCSLIFILIALYRHTESFPYYLSAQSLLFGTYCSEYFLFFFFCLIMRYIINIYSVYTNDNFRSFNRRSQFGPVAGPEAY